MEYMYPPMRMTFVVFVAAMLFCLSPALGKETAHMSGMKMEKVAIDAKLGGQVPLEATFFDESGREVTVGSLLKKPTLLTFVYLKCQHACPRLLNGVAGLIGESKLVPGKDYEVVTVSFDDTDTPKLAEKKKGNYVKAVGKPFPPGAWHFLTGNRESIAALTGAVGFHFKREKEGFTHPVTLVVLSRKGKVIRYLDGIDFLPFDLEMAVTEASEGRIGSVVRRAVLYCFSYDPKGKKYVFDILKVVGIVSVMVALGMIAFLVITGRKYRKGRE